MYGFYCATLYFYPISLFLLTVLMHSSVMYSGTFQVSIFYVCVCICVVLMARGTRNPAGPELNMRPWAAGQPSI